MSRYGLFFEPDGWKDYLYWQDQDRKTLKRINALLNDIGRDPHSGIGEPEPLKWNYRGYWSRKIDDCNRLIYRLRDGKTIDIIACRGHYDD